MRVRHSRDQWSQWIEQQAVSGLSVKAFCANQGIQVQSFYNWRNKLALENNESSSNKHLFVPVTVRNAHDFEIEFPCGTRIRVTSDQLVTALNVLHQLGVKR